MATSYLFCNSIYIQEHVYLWQGTSKSEFYQSLILMFEWKYQLVTSIFKFLSSRCRYTDTHVILLQLKGIYIKITIKISRLVKNLNYLLTKTVECLPSKKTTYCEISWSKNVPRVMYSISLCEKKPEYVCDSESAINQVAVWRHKTTSGLLASSMANLSSRY